MNCYRANDLVPTLSGLWTAGQTARTGEDNGDVYQQRASRDSGLSSLPGRVRRKTGRNGCHLPGLPPRLSRSRGNCNHVARCSHDGAQSLLLLIDPSGLGLRVLPLSAPQGQLREKIAGD